MPAARGLDAATVQECLADLTDARLAKAIDKVGVTVAGGCVESNCAQDFEIWTGWGYQE